MTPIDKIRALIQNAKRIQSRRNIEVELEKVLPTTLHRDSNDPLVQQLRTIYRDYGLKPNPNKSNISQPDLEYYDLKPLWDKLFDYQECFLVPEMLELLGLKRVEVPKGSP
jgi:hypothetical protein